ncbi:MAG: hypothetical protein ACLFR1_14760 [Spirochaetia bacterium]
MDHTVSTGLSRETADRKTDAEDISRLSLGELTQFFLEDPEIGSNASDSGLRINPFTGLPVVFSSNRASRPETYSRKTGCPICEGNITGIIDKFELSSGGFGFINKNLYPILMPRTGTEGARGFHFLLWPSNLHSKRFETMDIEDAVLNLYRTACLEKLLEEGGSPDFPETANSRHGYFMFIKNYGNRVGGSIEHDHFQALYSNTEPLAYKHDREYYNKTQVPVSRFYIQNTPAELVVYESKYWAVLVPQFIKRPGELIITSRNEAYSSFFQLPQKALQEMAEIMRSCFKNGYKLFQQSEETAFNLIFHTHPFTGIYAEFLPYIQPLGGFERLGFYVCQQTPEEAAEQYREKVFTD